MTSNTTDITIDTHQLHYQHWYNMKFTSSTSSPSLATDTTAKVRISITIINIGLSVTIYHGRTGLPIGTHVTANVDKIVHMIFEVHCSKHISICFNLFFWKNLLPGGNLVNAYLSLWTYINTYICLQENILKMQPPKSQPLLVIPGILETSRWSRGSHLGPQTVKRKM